MTATETVDDVFAALGVARRGQVVETEPDCLVEIRREEAGRLSANIAKFGNLLAEKEQEKQAVQDWLATLEVACSKIRGLIKLSEEYKKGMDKPFSFEPPSAQEADRLLQKINPIVREQRGSSIGDLIILALVEKPRNAQEIAAKTELTKTQIYAWAYTHKKYVAKLNESSCYYLTEAGKKLSEVINKTV